MRNDKKMPYRLTGLHFIEYNSYYPIPEFKYPENYSVLDEVLLFNIIQKKNIYIDFNTTYRPVFGIHISPNRYNGIQFGATKYKESYLKYICSKDFLFIKPLLDHIVLERLNILDKFYNITKN